MAKVRNNIVLRGLSGDLGKQLRIRTGRHSGQTNVCAIPEFHTEHKDSPAQEAHKEAFREASALRFSYFTSEKSLSAGVDSKSRAGRREI